MLDEKSILSSEGACPLETYSLLDLCLACCADPSEENCASVELEDGIVELQKG